MTDTLRPDILSDLDAPMTTADWLRAYAGWIKAGEYQMLDADVLEEAADELDDAGETMTDPERAAVLALCAEIHELARQRPLSAALRRLDQKAAEVEAMLRQERGGE